MGFGKIIPTTTMTTQKSLQDVATAAAATPGRGDPLLNGGHFFATSPLRQ